MNEIPSKIALAPPHPGEFIRDEILDELHLNVTEAAEALGVRRARRMIRRSWVIRTVTAAAVIRPLIRVCIFPVLRACLGAGDGGGLEPLAEGGGNGRVLVVPGGDAGGLVMVGLPSRVRAGS